MKEINNKAINDIQERAKDVFASLSEEEIEKNNKQTLQEAEQEYQHFKEAFEKGDCYLCGHPLKSYSPPRPCPHWLLRPANIKKDSIPEIFKFFPQFRVETYLKWVANLEKPFVNINNLNEEKDPTKIIESTITYKNFQWSFSCTKSDVEGHHNSKFGKEPHFHLEMRIDGNIFIKFNDFHIPFHEEDIFMIAMHNQDAVPFQLMANYGEGMEELFSGCSPEDLIDSLKQSSEDSAEHLNLQTLLMADEDETYSGEEIFNLIQESKETGIPFAKLALKLKGTKRVLITPGDDVPEIQHRTNTRKKNS